MKTLLIGLGCIAQVGKDYAAQQLKMYYDTERVAFADPLKEDLNKLLADVGVDLFTLDKDPALKVKLRPLMVEYGKAKRVFNQAYWINRALSRDFTHKVTLITDVRYENEVDKIKDMGGYYVHIVSDVPPSNAEEEKNQPILSARADFKVYNAFTPAYVQDLRSLFDALLEEGVNV